MNPTNCCHHKKKPWYQEPLFIVLIIIGFLLIVHFLLSLQNINVLAFPLVKFIGYLTKIWWAVGLGLLIGSLINILVPSALMVQFLGGGRKSIFRAVCLGFLASACSHGILAIAVSLYKKGASTASTLAFLLAAPWANFSITLLLFSLFGFKALLIIGGALFIALTAGLIFDFLEKKGIIEKQPKSAKKLAAEKITWQWVGWKKLFTGVIRTSWNLLKSVGWWVLTGLLIASFLGAFIPETIMTQYFGPSLFGLFLTLLLASLIEVCSEGSAPVAFEIFEKTKAFGNTFVFLQAGVVTDITEIGLVWTTIGKKAALALALIGIPLILSLGYLFNLFVY